MASTFIKDPNATLDYAFDWRDWLATSETITTYTAAAGEVVGAGTLATGDVIRVDVDVTGTGTKGLYVMIMARNL